MTHWEYAVIKEPNLEPWDTLDAMTSERLNAEGQHGWELVSVVTTAFDGHSSLAYYYFKRPKD